MRGKTILICALVALLVISIKGDDGDDVEPSTGDETYNDNSIDDQSDTEALEELELFMDSQHFEPIPDS